MSFSYSSGYTLVSHLILTCIFLISNNDNSFMCLIVICQFCEVFVQNLLIFLGRFTFLLLQYCSAIFVSSSSLSDFCFAKQFSQAVDYL